MAKRLGKGRRWEQGVGAMAWGSAMGKAGKGPGQGAGGGQQQQQQQQLLLQQVQGGQIESDRGKVSKGKGKDGHTESARGFREQWGLAGGKGTGRKEGKAAGQREEMEAGGRGNGMGVGNMGRAGKGGKGQGGGKGQRGGKGQGGGNNNKKIIFNIKKFKIIRKGSSAWPAST